MRSVLVLLLVTGCTSAISTTQSAETLDKGQFFVSAGNNISLPVGKAIDAVNQAYDFEEKLRDNPSYQPTEEEKQDYLTTGIGLALFGSGGNAEFMVRYGVLDHLDLGLRYSITGVHGDLKWQFLDDGPGGWHGAISLGYQHHIFDGAIFDLLEYVKIDDFERNDLELPILFGRSFGSRGVRKPRPLGTAVPLSGRYWFGPKLIVSKAHIDATLARFDETLSTDGIMYYYGGVAGGAIGLMGIELYGELTVMELKFNATVFGKERDLGGLIVMPAFGIQGTF